MIWPKTPGTRSELILLQEIRDCRVPLVLNCRAAPHHGALVEGDFREPLRLRLGGCADHSPAIRKDSDRACASSPSAGASRIAAGAIAPRLAGEQPTSVVRFIKSRTPSPDAKRALRAVGSTWFGPAMKSPIASGVCRPRKIAPAWQTRAA